MSTISSLSKHRKAVAKAERKKHADQNAVKFGMSKSERLLAAAQSEGMKARLDQAKFED